MRLTKVEIDYYRSIEQAKLSLPENGPLVLFGPNNAGKSNLISAIHLFLGERWPATHELCDSDFYMRDKSNYPNAVITCSFDDTYYHRNSQDYRRISLRLSDDPSASMFFSEAEAVHNGGDGKLFINKDNRKAIQSFLVNAERNTAREFSYSSQYSLLSKFSHALHSSLCSEQKKSLNDAFESISGTFEGMDTYKSFFDCFRQVVSDSVKGFSHSLEVDFSAYDPNNYASALRIVAIEGESKQSFDEFGTGEQQILLMAFAKAYVETFSEGSLVLIIEEPEAHLHPLAQRWLKEYLYSLCCDRMQVIISTHSPDFIDADNLEGLVRVTKNEQGTTTVAQISAAEMASICVSTGASPKRTSEDNISLYYKALLSTDQIKGLFAERVLIVEGPTEALSLPVLFSKIGHSPAQNGLEIVCANGKNRIPALWRFFSAYGIECHCLFDGDRGKGEAKQNVAFNPIFDVDVSNVVENASDGYELIGESSAFFTEDYESFMRAKCTGYNSYERQAREAYDASGKPEIARIAAMLIPKDNIPSFFCSLWNAAVGENPGDPF